MSNAAINRSTHVFFPPMSCLSFYLTLSEGLSLKGKEEDSNSLNVAKKICRLVLTAFGVPFLTVFFVFYNATGVAIKGTCAVITSMKATFFNHDFAEYISDVNRHIAFATKDLVTNYFIGFLCASHAFYENEVIRIDTLISGKIDELLQAQ